MTIYVKALILVALLGLGYAWGHHTAYVAGDREMQAHLKADAIALAAITEQVRQHEQANAQAIAAIDAQHEKELADAKVARDRTIADLRAGNRKLRDEWAGCQVGVPGTAPGSGEPDDAAKRRISGAGRAFEAVDEDAAKIRALQEIVKADRK